MREKIWIFHPFFERPEWPFFIFRGNAAFSALLCKGRGGGLFVARIWLCKRR
jgi:hypothetical protein